MKKTKKFVSILMAVMVLLSAMAVQSFACFDFEFPTLVKVELYGEPEVWPVSYKELKKFSEEYGEERMDILVPNFLSFHFSNGFVLNDACSYPLTADALMTVADATVDVKETMKAFENGATTVPVQVEVIRTQFDGSETSEFFMIENKIVKEIVSELKFLDTAPEGITLESYAEELFEGKKFEITYGDGTKKVEEITTDIVGCHYLDGQEIEISYREESHINEKGKVVYTSGIYVEFLDEEIVIDYKTHPCKYRDFEVLEYNFDQDGRLKDLTYRLTRKNGKVIEKKCDITPKENLYEEVIVDTVDGYNIIADMSISHIGGFTEDDEVCFDVTFGHREWNLALNDYVVLSDICDCQCHKAGISRVYYTLYTYILVILNIDVYCKCGHPYN